MNSWEDEFSAYDIDIINAKAAKKEEEITSTEKLQLPETDVSESTELVSDLTTPSSEESPANEQDNANGSGDTTTRQKADENKQLYDQLLAKVGKHASCVTQKDLEKVITLLDECTNMANQRPAATPQDESTPPNKRHAKRQRILSKQITKAIDVFVAARSLGRSFVSFDQTAYYEHLGKCQFLMQANMAARTFRNQWPVILKGETVQQAHDGIDKILVSTERLAKSLAEAIDAFPGEGGMMKLLEIISQHCDDHEFSCIEHTIQMAAEATE